ncbi:MAG: HEAT repeat domain-containing protein [Acidobacteriota bacterium]
MGCCGIAALWLSAACAPLQGPPPASPTTAGSLSSLPETLPHLELRARLLLLVDRQLYDPFTVEQAFDGDELLRRELARTLGRLRDARGVPLLKALTLDTDPSVRREAAFALGRLGDISARGNLERLLKDPDRQVALEAVSALGKLGVSALEVGEGLGVAEGLDEGELLRRLVPRLHHFGDATVPTFARLGLVRVGDPEVVESAARALARRPVAEAQGELEAVLSAPPTPRARALAARALGRLGQGESLSLLLPLLDATEPEVVIAALEVGELLVYAGRAAPPEAWRAPLLRAMSNSRPAVQAAAISASGAWLLDEEIGQALVDWTRADSNWLHGLALQALARGEDPRAADLIVAAASSRSAELRVEAARAAVLSELDEVLDALREDPSPRVRIAVLEADLAASARAIEGDSSLEEIAETPRRGLADEDGGVQGTALRWLGRFPVVPAMELLAAAGPRRDRLVEVRLAALAAMVPRVEAVVGEREESIEALKAVMTVRDRRVRRAAAQALRSLGETPEPLGPEPKRRTVADYEVMLLRFAEPIEAVLETDAGNLPLELLCSEVPLSCLSFVQLAESGFFDGLTIHRLEPDFVAETGDPRGDGWGGPGYGVRDEPWPARYDPGSLGLLSTEPDTGGSRFFITLSEQPSLDGRYTLFGRARLAADPEAEAVLHRLSQGTLVHRLVIQPRR